MASGRNGAGWYNGTSTLVRWYVSDDLYGSREKMERRKVGTRERKKLGFGDTSVYYLAENRGSTVCAMPGGAADH